VKNSTIFFTKEIPIYWGDYSQVDAEMQLFSTAKNQQEYSMYHLLSGVDLPLDTAENIYEFFDKRKEYNFLTMVSDELFKQNRVYERVAYKTLFSRLSSRSLNSRLLKKVLNSYRKLEIGIQRRLKIDFFKKFDLELKYASNWCSLNNVAVEKLIESSSLIKNAFKSGKVQDELFVPTILYKNGLLDSVYSLEPTNDQPIDFQGNLRYINWWDGSPYTWTDSEKDIEQLKYGKEQGHLFSRKFDLEKYPELKEKILEIIYEDK
jgi:glycosyltransferase